MRAALLALGLCLIGNAIASDCANEGGICTLGVFPHTSIRQVEVTYSTIAEELSLVLDRDVQLRTSTTVERFLQQLQQLDYDVAFAGLGHFMLVGEPAGYIPLARRREKLRYVVIAAPDSPLRTLDDLRGKRFGQMPAENGTTIATTVLLRSHGFDLDRDLKRFRFGSQQACIHALAADMVDACGLAEPVMMVFQNQMRMRFRVLGYSPAVSNIAYIASPNLSPQQIARLRDYFSRREGFVPATPGDYDEFRAILRRFGGS